MPSKLVLCVIDALAPAMLERAIAEGGAPTLAELVRRGAYIPDCVAAFPSVTPVCAASIVTGAWQDRHLIPGMNWYHRAEQRYVEYGSSFRASQRFGLARQLTDTVYNLNGAHLSRHTPTVFETLDDLGVRTAGTTYLMYRGRHRHEPQRDTALTRLAATLMRHPVMGPRELFYADIFASRPSPCRSTLGMPGVRDRHSGCVGAQLVEEDLFDFLLLSLPDNDWHSHRFGPAGQLQSIARADEQLARVMAPAGGVTSFLEDHAVIVMADHSQAPIASAIDLPAELAELGVLAPRSRRAPGSEQARIAVCPSQRAAMVYVLGDEPAGGDAPHGGPDMDALRGDSHADVSRGELDVDAVRSAMVRRALAVEGVELAMWLERDTHGVPAEAALARAGAGGPALHAGRRELRFCPGGNLLDAHGRSWSVEGDHGVIGANVRDGVLSSPDFPDALARAWAALTCPNSGEVLLSAGPGWEFADWGGQAHVGGGSHGSLRAEDSLGALVLCGLDADTAPVPVPEEAGVPHIRNDGPDEASPQWAIRDVAGLIARHFDAATLAG